MTSGDAARRGAGAEVWKTGGLLAALVLHNLIYPLTTRGGIGPLLFYALYAAMFAVAAWLLTSNAGLCWAAAATGAAVFAAGLANSYAPTGASALALYVTSIAYHGVIIVVLWRYIFGAGQVYTEVLLAAASLYLVIGSTFAAVFALIAWLQPGAFAATSGVAVDCQQLLYFSYITLTSVGYGDILPVAFYAQAFAAFEAIVGVLYTVILLSRLVGMHTTSR